MELIFPKLGEFIPALVSFSVVYFLLSKFAWPSLNEMLDKRAATIRDGLERAEAARMDAERLLVEYKETMAEARKEAGVIMTQAKQAAETIRAESSAQAQAEYDAMLDRAREAIAGEKQAAIAELQSSVADLSVAVASKLIGSNLSLDDHREVVEKYMVEAGSLNAN